MNVTNRKMFRPRTARNKLNQMGGIMASSPELMQTVQKFNLGGGVSTSYIPGVGYRQPTIPSAIARAKQQQLNLQRQRAINAGIADVPDTAFAPVTPSGLNQQALANLRGIPATMGQDLSDFYDKYIGPNAGIDQYIRDFLGVSQSEQPVMTNQFAQPEADVPDTAFVPAPRTTGATDDAGFIGNETDVLAPPLVNYGAGNMTAAEIQRAKDITSGKLTSSPEDVSPIPQIAPTREELEARLSEQDGTSDKPSNQTRQEQGQTQQANTGGFAGDQQTEDVEAAKRGELGPAAQVAAVVQQGTPEEKNQELKKLMAEFTENAPEYKGSGRGLALAKIGFAMAAGQSPNAITNIATALSDGADMLIKDKKDRDAFDRQVQLAGLQYGLKELGTRRAEARQEKAKGKTPNYFVATKDGKLPNGRTYKKDQNFMMTTEEILKFGLPENALIPSTFKTLKDNETATLKAAAKVAQDGVMDPKVYLDITGKVREAATEFESANQLRELVEGNIIRNAKGEITGLNAAFNGLVGQAFAAFDITPDKKYTSKAEYDAEMTTVANKLLKDLLGEGSKNVSNIDRTLANEIVGLYKNIEGKQSAFSYVTVPQTVLNGRLQRVLTTLDQKERNALGAFAEAQSSVYGYTLRGGREITLNIPEAARAQLEGDTEYKPPFALVDGVYRRQ